MDVTIRGVARRTITPSGCMPPIRRAIVFYRSLSVLACLVVLGSNALHAADVQWQRINLDKTFRSEGVAAFDVNHDGQVDVVAGDVWYEAPNWKMHEIRTPGKYIAGQGLQRQLCATSAYDVNGDGWVDLICIGFPGADFHWYENPKNAPGHWKEHLIWHSACNETPNFLDLTGSRQTTAHPRFAAGGPDGVSAHPSRETTRIPSGRSTPSACRATRRNRGSTTGHIAFITAWVSAISTRTAATTC